MGRKEGRIVERGGSRKEGRKDYRKEGSIGRDDYRKEGL